MEMTPLLLLLGLGLFVVLPGVVRGQCVPVSGLPFCSSVNYSVNASSFANAGSTPQEQDKLVQAWYAKNAPDQLQTRDCLDAWKAYLCSFYFPKCPYCRESNGICRSACLALTARCAHQVQDFMAACYGGNLFVNDTDNSSLCTPYTLPNTRPAAVIAAAAADDVITKAPPPDDAPEVAPPLYQCQLVPEAYASFCKPTWPVASAPTNFVDVWTRMDNVTQLRWSTFASGGVTDACKDSLRLYFCAEYFAPCNGPFSVSNPLTEVLLPLCARLQNDCPAGMVRKVCSFNPYAPPDPRECRA